jgi:hypothetical protein
MLIANRMLYYFRWRKKFRRKGYNCWINRLKPKLVWIIIKNSVRTAKKASHFTVTKITWLTLLKEIIAANSKNHTKHINTNSSVTDCWSRSNIVTVGLKWLKNYNVNNISCFLKYLVQIRENWKQCCSFITLQNWAWTQMRDDALVTSQNFSFDTGQMHLI